MVSVVIPAFNEEKLIGKCLESLAAQKTKYPFEVIVVNNCSTDNTVREVKKYIGKLNLKIVTQNIKGRGPARRKGFENIHGEIILSTDADTTVPPNWVEMMVLELKRDKTIAVTGSCMINDCDKLTNSFFNLMQPASMRLYRIFFGHYWLSGFNFGIYKDVYIKAGKFSNTIDGIEDIELAFRVSRLGKIKFIPDPVVIFSGRRFRQGVIKGIKSYISIFIKYFLLKKEEVVLSDVR